MADSIRKSFACAFTHVFEWACEVYGKAAALICAEVQRARRAYLEACA